MKSVSGETQNLTITKRSSNTELNNNSHERISAKDKEKGLTDAVSDILTTSNELEQDKMEGVDANEWE